MLGVNRCGVDEGRSETEGTVDKAIRTQEGKGTKERD